MAAEANGEFVYVPKSFTCLYVLLHVSRVTLAKCESEEEGGGCVWLHTSTFVHVCVCVCADLMVNRDIYSICLHVVTMTTSQWERLSVSMHYDINV